MNILAIDPGNLYSAYCLIDADTLRPLQFGKVLNDDLRADILNGSLSYDRAVIEKVASYGMAVGAEVFDTCVWIGIFTEDIAFKGCKADYLFRREEKLHICHDSRAKDSNIRIALIDRFAQHDKRNGKGTTKNPDWFFGFRADIWAAYAVGLTYIETKLKEEKI